ncbi:hypothetical protein GOC21_25355 [Sinorhizobium meliloti]|nr:hypothetical protein [Sinorhizobium meliloti]
MSLDRTEALITVVESNVGEDAGPVSSFLAQYLAVILYAEMEERVAEIVKVHLEGHTHKAVAGFITASLNDLIKRLPKSDIAKLTARFGDEFRERFNQAMDDKNITLYMNVIEARHEIGHKRGSNITLGDVRKGHAAANEILTAFTKCLAEH